MRKIFYSAYLVSIMIFTMAFAYKYRYIMSIGEIVGVISIGLNATLFISEQLEDDNSR